MRRGKKSALFLVVLLQGCAQSRTSCIPVLEATKSHSVVVLAKVVKVGDPPLAGSGIYVSTQDVAYKVLDVYKGDVIAGTEIVVHHVILGNGPVEDHHTGGSLRADIFAPGHKLVLFLERDGLVQGFWVSGDDAMGVVPVE